MPGHACGEQRPYGQSPRAWLQAAALDKKPARRAALEKLQGEAFAACLVGPFVEAARSDRRRSLRALARAWITHMAHVQVRLRRAGAATM